jgi:hypothetical protein
MNNRDSHYRCGTQGEQVTEAHVVGDMKARLEAAAATMQESS